MPVNATSLANMSAPFFRLPLEIRQDVYGHVFPSKIFHLSEQKVDLFKSRVATLLTTCHTIYMEGTPYFYKEVHIRFLMSWRTPKQTIELTQIRLPLLMHISIDLCCLGLVKRFRKRVLERYKAHTDGVHDDWSDYPELVAEEGADRQVAACINTISADCPLLRSFTMHLLFSRYLEESDDGRPKDFLNEALEGGFMHTFGALQKLKVRDTIAIIFVTREKFLARSKDCTHQGIRLAIAPLDQWEMLPLKKWPGIALTDEQQFEVNLFTVEEFNRSDDAGICLWYFQPPGSKALWLPDYRLTWHPIEDDFDEGHMDGGDFDGDDFDDDDLAPTLQDLVGDDDLEEYYSGADTTEAAEEGYYYDRSPADIRRSYQDGFITPRLWLAIAKKFPQGQFF